MSISVVVFTSDLRLHDNPVLRAGVDRSVSTVPLFVRDPGVDAAGGAAPNRLAFLGDCLADLDAGLRRRGGRLVLREGDCADQAARVAAEVGADEVHIASGVSRFATRREARLRAALEADGRRLHAHTGVITAVPPEALRPSGSGADHFSVFSAYHRRWTEQPLRRPLAAPHAVLVPEGVGSARLAPVAGVSPGLAEGGETRARARFAAWLRTGLPGYHAAHDDLAGDTTSRLSPHLHFGTLSATELVRRARGVGGPGAEAFIRQLCWRDFQYQVLAARPGAAVDDYRRRGDRWRGEPEAAAEIAAWREGRTGYPIVDAGMRQLRHEGWMHNRARLIAASFLTKTLYVDWRIGADHFRAYLVDGDLANNQLNWQWVAGTGTDTRPNRVLNPLRQARRYDPEGAYVRRWVPELAGVAGSGVHEPWRLPDAERAGYPDPVVDLAEGAARFRRARGSG